MHKGMVVSKEKISEQGFQQRVDFANGIRRLSQPNMDSHTALDTKHQPFRRGQLKLFGFEIFFPRLNMGGLEVANLFGLLGGTADAWLCRDGIKDSCEQ